jgi:hypothetical protein
VRIAPPSIFPAVVGDFIVLVVLKGDTRPRGPVANGAARGVAASPGATTSSATAATPGEPIEKVTHALREETTRKEER